MEELNFMSQKFLNETQSTKNLSDKTIIAYRSDLSDFIGFVGEKPIDDSTIIEYVKHLSTERQLQGSSINRKLVVLKVFFEFLYSNNYTEENFYNSHIFKFKKERKLPKIIATKDAERLLISFLGPSLLKIETSHSSSGTLMRVKKYPAGTASN